MFTLKTTDGAIELVKQGFGKGFTIYLKKLKTRKKNIKIIYQAYRQGKHNAEAIDKTHVKLQNR